MCPIITKPVSITFSEENLEYLKFQISYSTTDSNTRPDYKEVFENIKLLFHSLDSLNVSVSDDHHVFSIIGEHLSNSFLQLLIDECLMNALPETLEGLQTVSLVEDVLKFENLLCDLYLINREVEQRLTKFTDNFETLFHNRLFRRILDTGKEIMQKDMQDMTVMAEKNTPEDVANNPFLFPRCMVSKSVLVCNNLLKMVYFSQNLYSKTIPLLKEFVKLLSRIIRQDSEAPNEDNQSRFLSIISVLINSYITVVPQYHKEHLENLPQQAVLFYCNCMFLHHFLAKNFGIPNVTNLVKNLSLAGTKYLRQQVNKQLSVLQEILKPKGEKEQNITISSVHECLDHLRLLESLWQPVLPVKEYNKTMGELISSCCFILNQQILSKEIITSLEAKVMVDIFELFKHKVGSLIKVNMLLLLR